MVARKRRINKWTNKDQPDYDADLTHLVAGFTRTEHKRDGAWTVQSISAGRSQKVYTCPGCHREVSAGVAHIVAWRADNIFGEESAIQDRRHWHTHCWKVN